MIGIRGSRWGRWVAFSLLGCMALVGVEVAAINQGSAPSKAAVVAGGLAGRSAVGASTTTAAATTQPPQSTTTTAAATTQPPQSTTTPPASTTVAPQSADAVTAGYWSDGVVGVPRYVLSVSGSGAAKSGWLYFVYQDGRTSPVSHYHLSGSGTYMTLVTDQAPARFAVGSPPAFPQAGSTPMAAGRSLPASLSGGTLSLTGCGGYLYWVAHAVATCVFHYVGATYG